MLGLKMATDPRWANIVEMNIEDILTDHAWCEQKAASSAISTLTRFPDHPELVDELIRVSLEEMTHFKMVIEEIKKRGMTLGFEQKDSYVGDLKKFIKKGGGRTHQLVEALLLSAMIEARSCERFRILSEEIKDEQLRKFYRDLMVSEAEHYTMFIGFARKYGVDLDVDSRWQEFLDFEAGLMEKYGKGETIHG